jgi:hypothetical protein
MSSRRRLSRVNLKIEQAKLVILDIAAMIQL